MCAQKSIRRICASLGPWPKYFHNLESHVLFLQHLFFRYPLPYLYCWNSLYVNYLFCIFSGQMVFKQLKKDDTTSKAKPPNDSLLAQVSFHCESQQLLIYREMQDDSLNVILALDSFSIVNIYFDKNLLSTLIFNTSGSLIHSLVNWIKSSI